MAVISVFWRRGHLASGWTGPVFSGSLHGIAVRRQNPHAAGQGEQIVRQALVDRDTLGIHLVNLLAVPLRQDIERPLNAVADVAILGKDLDFLVAFLGLRV